MGQQVLAVIFLTYVGSLLCPTSISLLPPSADCLILWTANSSRLFSSAFLCQLTVSLCLLWDLPSNFHFRSRGRSHSQPFVWISRQNRQRDRPSGANTNRNELLRIVSHSFSLFSFFFLFAGEPIISRGVSGSLLIERDAASVSDCWFLVYSGDVGIGWSVGVG